MTKIVRVLAKCRPTKIVVDIDKFISDVAVHQETATVMQGNQNPVSAYTIKQFCEEFGIGRSLAYAEIAAGRLRSRKVGKRTLVMRSDVERWAESLPEGKRSGHS